MYMKPQRSKECADSCPKINKKFKVKKMSPFIILPFFLSLSRTKYLRYALHQFCIITFISI